MNKNLILGGLLLLLNSVAQGNSYFVSPNGNDTNNGLTINSPVKTIQAGIDKATLSNDVVYVLAGTYKETITISQNDITVQNYQTDIVIIDGTTILSATNNGSLVTITGNNNKLIGLEIKNSNSIGKYTSGNGVTIIGNHNTLDTINVHHIWEYGLMINGDYTTIQNSNVYQTSRKNSSGLLTANWTSAISIGKNDSVNSVVAGITSYTTLKKTSIFNNWGEGIILYQSANSIIEDNIIYDNWTTNFIAKDTANNTIQRNIIYNSTKNDISYKSNTKPVLLLLTDEDGSKPRSQHNTIINNAFFNGSVNLFNITNVVGSGLNYVLFFNNTIIDGKIVTGNTTNANSQIRNNIIQGNTTMVSFIPSNTGIVFSNNNWNVQPPTPAKSNTDIIGNPSLYRYGSTSGGSLSKAFFTLLAGSGVINKGATLTEVTEDIYQRPRDVLTDIGCHEYQPLQPIVLPVCKLVCTQP